MLTCNSRFNGIGLFIVQIRRQICNKMHCFYAHAVGIAMINHFIRVTANRLIVYVTDYKERYRHSVECYFQCGSYF